MYLCTLSTRPARRGLTLIELVVVLAILAALAGLIIGNFPGLLQKSTGATSANTLQDISRALSVQFVAKNSYGAGYDSLLDSLGANAFANLPPACTNTTQLTPAALSAGDASALKNLGITNVYNLVFVTDATWTSSDASPSTPVAAGATLASAGTNLLAKLLGDRIATLSSPTVYIFGLGKRSTVVGPDGVLLEAPTRTGTTDLENSQNYYQRYCVAFLVDGASSRNARFLTTLAPTSLGFSVTDDATQMYSSN